MKGGGEGLEAARVWGDGLSNWSPSGRGVISSRVSKLSALLVFGRGLGVWRETRRGCGGRALVTSALWGLLGRTGVSWVPGLVSVARIRCSISCRMSGSRTKFRRASGERGHSPSLRGPPAYTWPARPARSAEGKGVRTSSSCKTRKWQYYEELVYGLKFGPTWFKYLSRRYGIVGCCLCVRVRGLRRRVFGSVMFRVLGRV